MKVLLLILAMIAAATLSPNALSQENKAKSVDAVLDITVSAARVEAFEVGDDLKQKIHQLDLASASRLATIAWTLYSPGDAASAAYDERWYSLFRLAILRIPQSTTNPAEAIAALLKIKSRLNLNDGGESLIIGEMISDLKK